MDTIQSKPPTTPEVSEDFQKAFDDLLLDEPNSDAPPKINPPADDNTQVVEQKTEADTNVPPDPFAEEHAEAQKPAPKTDEQQAFSYEELAKAIREGARPEPVRQQEPQPQPREPYTKEQLDLVKKYHEEWPDVAMAEEIKRRADLQAAVEYVFQVINPVLQSLGSGYTQVASRTHADEIHTLDPDYDEVRDKVVDWALNGEHPGYLKSAYQHVVQQGSAQEIHDLIGRWRAANGQADPSTQQQTAAAQAQAQAQAKTAQEAKKKAAAAALAPVGSKRSGVVTQGVDASDFSGAFEMFSKSLT